MKLFVFLEICFCLTFSDRPNIYSLYASENSVENKTSFQEEYNFLLQRFLEKGYDPNGARQRLNYFLENRDKRRLERELNEAEREKELALTKPSDIDFKIAMNKDLSFGEGEGRTQKDAILAWEEILYRKDISDEQRLFATWRIGCMLCGNYDPKRREKPDFTRGEKMLKDAMYIIPNLYCKETINSATLYGSLPGTKLEKAVRLAESYKFIKTATSEKIIQSAKRVNRNGRIIDKRFFSHIARLSDPNLDEKTKRLRGIVEKGIESMDQSICSFLKYCTDDSAALLLLNQLQEYSSSKELEKWHNIRREYYLSSSVNEAASATLEDIKNKSLVKDMISNQTENPINSYKAIKKIAPQLPITEKILADQQDNSYILIFTVVTGLIFLGIIGCFIGRHYFHK